MSRPVRAAIVAALAAACMAGLPAAAQMYKWVDAEGKVHYSDQPPPPNARKSTTMGARKPAPRSAPSSDEQSAQPEPGQEETATAAAKPSPARPKTAQELDAEFRQRQLKAAEEEAQRRKEQEELAEKNRNCQQAKNNVARLQAGGRIARTNDQGESEILGDAEIAAELERARQIADSWCK